MKDVPTFTAKQQPKEEAGARARAKPSASREPPFR